MKLNEVHETQQIEGAVSEIMAVTQLSRGDILQKAYAVQHLCCLPAFRDGVEFILRGVRRGDSAHSDRPGSNCESDSI